MCRAVELHRLIIFRRRLDRLHSLVNSLRIRLRGLIIFSNLQQRIKLKSYVAQSERKPGWLAWCWRQKYHNNADNFKKEPNPTIKILMLTIKPKGFFTTSRMIDQSNNHAQHQPTMYKFVVKINVWRYKRAGVADRKSEKGHGGRILGMYVCMMHVM